MAFRYINPGYGALTGDSSVNTFTSSVYNPLNGIAFQKCGTSTDNEVKIAVPQAFTTDIYGRFNLYLDADATSFSNFYIGAISTLNGSSPTYCIGVKATKNGVYFMDGRYVQNSSSALKLGAVNSIWFHINISSSTFTGEMIVNDETITQTITNSQYTFSNQKFFFISFSKSSYNADKAYISELIISDEYISPREKIIVLPISATSTDMTAGQNGIYIADAVNQTLLQTPDVNALLNEYGATSQVTGIALVGNPAYKTDEGISSLIALSKTSSIVAEHNSCSLDTVTTATIMDGWKLNNVTVNDLNNMQFGWKAGA